MFFFPFLCSAIPDLDLGILKIEESYFQYVFVMPYNQQSINLFRAWYGSQPVSTINVQYLQQIFAIYNY